jgi:hypothetical protein
MSQHWTLWYHDPANNDYSLQSYIRVFEVKDVSDFWTIVDGIPKEMWESGMFFFMRGDIPPLWDAPRTTRAVHGPRRWMPPTRTPSSSTAWFTASPSPS